MGRLARYRKIKTHDLTGEKSRKPVLPPSAKTSQSKMPRKMRRLIQLQEQAKREERERKERRAANKKNNGNKQGGAKGSGSSGSNRHSNSSSTTRDATTVRPAVLFYEAFKSTTNKAAKNRKYFEQKKAKAQAKKAKKKAKEEEAAKFAAAKKARYERSTKAALAAADAAAAAMAPREGFEELTATQAAEVAELERLNSARYLAEYGEHKRIKTDADLVDRVAFGEQALTVPKLTVPDKWKTLAHDPSRPHRNVEIVEEALNSKRARKHQASTKRRRNDATRTDPHAEHDDADEHEAARPRKRSKKAKRTDVVSDDVRALVQKQYRLHRNLQAQRRAIAAKRGGKA